MMSLERQIAEALLRGSALTLAEVSARLCMAPDQVVGTLRDMDEAGEVRLRNGFYSLTPLGIDRARERGVEA